MRLLLGMQASWETDADGVVVTDSPSWRAYTGQTTEEWLGYGWLDAIHPDDRAYAERQWREAIAARRPVDAEFRLRALGGGWRWTNVRAVPVLDGQGRIGKWAGLNVDIDERKRAEAALRESEERQAFLLKLSDALRLESDPAGVAALACRLLVDELDASRAQYTVVIDHTPGAEIAEVQGEHVRSGAPMVRHFPMNAYGEALVDGLRRGETLVLTDIERDPRISEAERSGLRGANSPAAIAVPRVTNGRLAMTFTLHDRQPRDWTRREVMLVEEVAERTWAAVERARAEAALRDSEERFRNLFETMGQAYVLLDIVRDADGVATDVRILELNPAYGRLMGVDMEAARGRCVYQLFPNVDRWWLETCDRVARSGRPDRVEHRYNDPGDWFECWLYPRGENRIEALFEQITERKRAEERLRASEERQAFLLRLSDALRRLSQASDIQMTASRLLGDQLNVSRTMYAEVISDEKTGGAIIRGQHVRDGERFPDRIPSSMFDETFVGGSMWTDDRVVMADIASDPRIREEARQAWLASGIAAAVAVALVKDERLVVIFGVHHARPRKWSADEVALIEEVAERTWAAAERARAEAALRESEERLRSFAEASSDVFWIIDADGERLEYLSPAYEAIWGEPRDAVLADIGHWARRVHPDDRVRAGEAMAVLKSGERIATEYRIIRPNGETRYIHDTGFPIVADGQIRRLAGVAQDLTDRHRAERALAAAEQRARTLMEGVPQLVWRAADGGGCRWTSPQWTAFTGQAEPNSHEFGWLDPVHPDDRDATMAAWGRAIETGEFGVEYRLRDRNGAYSWFSARATPVRDETGQVVEWLGTSTDIHALRQLQERQGVLVAELQHRTRNLIGVVRSLAERTIDGAVSMGDFEERFGQRLAALSRVQGLLSHLSAGQRVAFDELLRSELVALGAIDREECGGRVALDGPGDVQLRSATVQTFALALHELATNAVKYGALSTSNPDGRLAVCWRVEPVDGDGQPRLLVEWQESGVVIPHVGAPARGGGYGRELIERALPYQLGAKTSYELSVGGVRCTIAVPVEGTGKAEPRRVSEALLRDRRILVVEDEYFIADMMERGLRKHGAIVVGPAPSVGNALALLDAEHVDAALVDLNLGGEQAFPVADALQARGVPFLFTTGYNASHVPPAWQHVRRLEKPVDVATVARALASSDDDRG